MKVEMEEEHEREQGETGTNPEYKTRNKTRNNKKQTPNQLGVGTNAE